MTIKIKNRNSYDIIYECLSHCKEYENSETFPTTKTRFFTVLGGNNIVFRKVFDNVLIKQDFIEINHNIEHYRDVYKITEKGLKYMEYYEKMKQLLGGYNE